MSKHILTTEDAALLRASDVWIFDLDNTLYAADTDLFAQIDQRMGKFICDFLGLSHDEARALQKNYFHEHGTTLNGLMLNHGVVPEEFLDYVHDIDYSPIQVDARLDRALDALPGRKLVYTNGTVAHAENAMKQLEVTHHFEAIFDIVAAEFMPKPRREPYDKMMRDHGIDPAGAVFVEDMAKNLRAPAEMGMRTVWVHTASDWAQAGRDEDFVHFHTDDLPGWLCQVAGLDPA